MFLSQDWEVRQEEGKDAKGVLSPGPAQVPTVAEDKCLKPSLGGSVL